MSSIYNNTENDMSIHLPKKSEELPEEAKEILKIIYLVFEKEKLDPILSVFKSDSILYEFYHKRIFEIITEKLGNEQEKKISFLESENVKLKNTIQILNDKLNQADFISSDISNEKNKLIQTLNSLNEEIKIKNEENNKLISQLQEITQDLNNKNEQINFFKENLNGIKIKQEEMNSSLNNVLIENVELKKEIKNKNIENEELKNQIENIKKDYENKNNELEQQFNKLKNESENVLKIKIQALRNKLREKIEIINKMKEKDEKEINLNDKEDIIN